MERKEVLDKIEAKARTLTDGYVKYAKLAMVELERANLTSFVLLKHDDLGKWWAGEIKRETAKETKYQEALKVYDVKMAAWSRLDESERKILGIRKPTKPKKGS